MLTVLLTPWGPIVLLLLGAVILWPLNVRRTPQVVRSSVILLFTLSFVWILGWRLSPVPIEHVLSVYGPLGVPFFVSLRVSSVAWSFAVLIAMAGLLGALGMRSTPPSGYVSGPGVGLVLIAGALLMVLADNLPALFLGWLVMDAAYMALLLDVQRMVSRLVVLVLGGFLLLWTVMIVAPREVVISSWSEMVYPKGLLVLLMLSVWWRLGVYPFTRLHVFDVPDFPLPWLGIEIVAGAGWLSHWLFLPGTNVLWTDAAWWGIGSFAFFGGALAAWLADERAQRLKWVMGQRASAIVLLGGILGVNGVRVVLALSAITLLIPFLLELLLAETPSRFIRGLQLLAILTLWGGPWTLGGGVRMVLYHFWTWHLGVGLILLLGDGLVLAALLLSVEAHESSEPLMRRSMRGVLAGIGIGGMFLGGMLWWGRWLRVANMLSPTTLYIYITLIPLTTGALLAWQHNRIVTGTQLGHHTLQHIIFLIPGESLVNRIFHWLHTAIGGTLYLIEGPGWLGWLFLGALIAIGIK